MTAPHGRSGPLSPVDPPDVVAVRRDLHAHPELGFTEIRTAAVVYRTLEALGWPLRCGQEVFDATGLPGLPEPAVLEEARARPASQGVPPDLLRRFSGGHTALVAELTGDRPGPTVAFRFDLDALPISETTSPEHAPRRAGFASTHPGIMHACGHDGHVAIGLALAHALADRSFPGTVRLLFQPAEEGVRGAEPMVEAGMTGGVDALIAVHLGFGLPSGELAVSATELHATAKYAVRFTGRAAHAAKAPDTGRNALLAAACAALNLHALPRFAGATTRVNVGRLVAGSAANIVPEHAELVYETRSDHTEAHDELDRRARLVVQNAAAMYEVRAETLRTGHASAAVTDEAVARALTDAASGLAGVRRSHPLGASDDASLLMEAVQRSGGVAGYAIAGSDSPGPPHSPGFDVDEAVLPVVVRWLERLVRTGAAADRTPTDGRASRGRRRTGEES
jgi:aminobenzoyl-glutamate utilization protein A